MLGELYSEHLATSRYFERTFNCNAIKVLPGEYFVSDKEEVIVTVLGSCIAACIRDKERGIGGLNHFMLPDGGEVGVASSSARYGAFAMEVLINHLIKSGAKRSNLEAKVFGGGKVMATLSQSQVGERNSQFVLDYLHTERIPVVAKDLLDIYPRKVFYFPATGKVMVKKMVKVHNESLFVRESEYAQKLKGGGSVSGDIELFS